MPEQKGMAKSVLIALFGAVIAVCSFIYIPTGAVPVTLQLFAVCVSAGVLGRAGAVSVLVYLLLGIIGLPVFSGFQAGVSALAGPTGGFLLGFLPLAFVSGLIIEKTGRRLANYLIAFSVGTVICYASGLVMYMYLYCGGNAGLIEAFTVCILPYIIPDAVKIVLAAIVTRALRERVKI